MMGSRMDYKKRLLEYRKSIGATTPKTVAFREHTSYLDEDIQVHSSQPPVQTFYYQHQKPWLPSPEKESVEENRRSASSESSVLKLPSPQPQTNILPTPGYVREASFLSEPIGRYSNWNSHHALLASQPWCCIGDLMAFCDKYEFKAISVSEVQTHAYIVKEAKALLSGKAPFDMRRRFPGNIRNEANLMVCIGRCPSIEYHLQRILTIFRRPLNKLSTDKQNIAKQNFHIAIRELHLDVTGRITEIRLYDRMVFEKEFHLKWQDSLE